MPEENTENPSNKSLALVLVGALGVTSGGGSYFASQSEIENIDKQIVTATTSLDRRLDDLSSDVRELRSEINSLRVQANQSKLEIDFVRGEQWRSLTMRIQRLEQQVLGKFPTDGVSLRSRSRYYPPPKESPFVLNSAPKRKKP